MILAYTALGGVIAEGAIAPAIVIAAAITVLGSRCGDLCSPPAGRPRRSPRRPELTSVDYPLGLHGLAVSPIFIRPTRTAARRSPSWAQAAWAKAGAECVLLTDHDTLEAKRRGDWEGRATAFSGCFVGPRGVAPKGGHLLVFGVERGDWAQGGGKGASARILEVGAGSRAGSRFLPRTRSRRALRMSKVTRRCRRTGWG